MRDRIYWLLLVLGTNLADFAIKRLGVEEALRREQGGPIRHP